DRDTRDTGLGTRTRRGYATAAQSRAPSGRAQGTASPHPATRPSTRCTSAHLRDYPDASTYRYCDDTERVTKLAATRLGITSAESFPHRRWTSTLRRLLVED